MFFIFPLLIIPAEAKPVESAIQASRESTCVIVDQGLRCGGDCNFGQANVPKDLANF